MYEAKRLTQIHFSLKTEGEVISFSVLPVNSFTSNSFRMNIKSQKMYFQLAFSIGMSLKKE